VRAELQQLRLLAPRLIIEKASGLTYEDYVEKKIFEAATTSF
jgi:CubicO group peptidase (beta-lactamase class C family)